MGRKKKPRNLKTLTEDEKLYVTIAAYWLSRPVWAAQFNLDPKHYLDLRVYAALKVDKNLLNSKRKEFLCPQKK